ncbi:hypothetical protein OGAPHI_004986 [Ogataea philodendri]|uniref:Large ribosomal subunit protein mL49 n=1 Tax=Ogataea philodendri TaxID=1378263 RepID=A0A9P8P1J9_9ASCO|nr:uncharacterized protein OGAPHI_004986 [Ogataea philodendri]KAH3663585.1 hypothetical protein OGAPHI_004986 [Ogataea philodendri]
MWNRVVVRHQSTAVTGSLLKQTQQTGPVSRLSKVFPQIEQVNAENLYTKPFRDFYHISRTSKGNLPVYKTIKSQAVNTEVRKVQGNLPKLREDVQKLFPNKPKDHFICKMQSMTLYIKGDVSKELKKYLEPYF